MKEVPLLNSDLVAIVDDEDFNLVSPYRWKLTTGTTGINYAYAYSDSTRYWMHVLILRPADGLVTDHIDFDGLNNRRNNLRAVTQQINTLHQRLRKDNKSGYRGVHRDEHGKWVAAIWHDGKSKRLGQFATPMDAARAFDRAAYELRGDNAMLNFPDLVERERVA